MEEIYLRNNLSDEKLQSELNKLLKLMAAASQENKELYVKKFDAINFILASRREVDKNEAN